MANQVSYKVAAHFTPVTEPKPDTRGIGRKALESAGSILWNGATGASKRVYNATKFTLRGGGAYLGSTMAVGYARQVGMENVPLLNHASSYITCAAGNGIFRGLTGYDAPGCGGPLDSFSAYYVSQKEEWMLQLAGAAMGYAAVDIAFSGVEYVAQKGYDYVTKMIFTTPEEPAKVFSIDLTPNQVEQLTKNP